MTTRVPLQESLIEVENYIKSIRKIVKKATDAFDEDEDEAALKVIQKIKAQELQGIRLYSTIKHNQQMMTVRFLDSPEWVSLSAGLVTAVVDCDKCRKKVRKMLVAHNAIESDV